MFSQANFRLVMVSSLLDVACHVTETTESNLPHHQLIDSKEEITITKQHDITQHDI